MAISVTGTASVALLPASLLTVLSAATSTDSNSTTTAPTDDIIGTSTDATGSGDQVSLSAEAQQAQTPTDTSTSTSTTTPPADRGALVFDAEGATVGGKRVALMDIIDNTDGTYTDTERQAAVRQINQRETAGFRWAAPDSQDPVALKQYYATYLNYLTNLPPEEQNSSRYAGQIDVAHQLIQNADRQITMNSVQQISLASYSDSSGLGLFGPLMAGISTRVSQQLAGLPNTNLTSTALYFQQVISQPRTADQVLATPDPSGDDGSSANAPSDGTPSDVTDAQSAAIGQLLNIQA